MDPLRPPGKGSYPVSEIVLYPSTHRDQGLRGRGWIMRTTCSVMELAPRIAAPSRTTGSGEAQRAGQSTPWCS
jgi:hypothetical protein